MLHIAIIGQGYVGLLLALLFSEVSCKVYALDVDQSKISKLKEGKSYIKHIGENRIKHALDSGRFIPTTDFKTVNEADAVLICVPTPLDDHHQPDMSYVVKTARSIGPNLSPKMTIH